MRKVPGRSVLMDRLLVRTNWSHQMTVVHNQPVIRCASSTRNANLVEHAPPKSVSTRRKVR